MVWHYTYIGWNVSRNILALSCVFTGDRRIVTSHAMCFVHFIVHCCMVYLHIFLCLWLISQQTLFGLTRNSHHIFIDIQAIWHVSSVYLSLKLTKPHVLLTGVTSYNPPCSPAQVNLVVNDKFLSSVSYVWVTLIQQLGELSSHSGQYSLLFIIGWKCCSWIGIIQSRCCCKGYGMNFMLSNKLHTHNTMTIWKQ